jgi:deoxyribodipyrimidine photo-lyase
MVFTRDLRLADNPALTAAAARTSAVLPLFVLDGQLIALCGAGAARLRFLQESLVDLDAQLRQLGGALVVRRGRWLPTVLDAARSAAASEIHLADDVSAHAQKRVARLTAAARACGITVRTHPGVTIVPPAVLRSGSGLAYRVFTPYYRRWLEMPRRPAARPPARVNLPASYDPRHVRAPAALIECATPITGQAGGELAGLSQLRRWTGSGLAGYDTGRDALAARATSRLSAYLHLGCLSPLAVEEAVRDLPDSVGFVRQLAWRDFFSQLLAARPDAAWSDLTDRGDEWADDQDALQTWQAGQTGYPVVDAAMRQLRAEGFMPGRARMITASFLAKDLYLDWGLGAAHFQRHLVDADIACNQLNWQWVAGTGTDQNRHRVFNPVRQGHIFDPDGDYVRRYVPELASLPTDRIHDPAPADRRAARYPAPIIDHRDAVAASRARRHRTTAGGTR